MSTGSQHVTTNWEFLNHLKGLNAILQFLVVHVTTASGTEVCQSYMSFHDAFSLAVTIKLWWRLILKESDSKSDAGTQNIGKVVCCFKTKYIKWYLHGGKTTMLYLNLSGHDMF